MEVDRRTSQSQVPPEQPSVDFAANLLQAAGGTIQAVRIEELQDQLFYAKVLVKSRNGGQEVKARLGDALALAHREGSAIVVEDALMARLGVSLPTTQGSTLGQ